MKFVITLILLAAAAHASAAPVAEPPPFKGAVMAPPGIEPGIIDQWREVEPFWSDGRVKIKLNFLPWLWFEGTPRFVLVSCLMAVELDALGIVNIQLSWAGLGAETLTPCKVIRQSAEEQH